MWLFLSLTLGLPLIKGRWLILYTHGLQPQYKNTYIPDFPGEEHVSIAQCLQSSADTSELTFSKHTLQMAISFGGSSYPQGCDLALWPH